MEYEVSRLAVSTWPYPVEALSFITCHPQQKSSKQGQGTCTISYPSITYRPSLLKSMPQLHIFSGLYGNRTSVTETARFLLQKSAAKRGFFARGALKFREELRSVVSIWPGVSCKRALRQRLFCKRDPACREMIYIYTHVYIHV